MNLTSPSQVSALLRELDFHPSKGLGQNFLIDRNILDILVSLAELSENDHVLEIGPGLGVLTEALAAQAGKVTAVEKDRRLCAYLRERFSNTPNLELIEGDALQIDLEAMLAAGVTKVASNLPYSIGNRILVNIITAPAAPRLFLAMVQRDVARRLVAPSGQKDYGTLSLYAQMDYAVKIEKDVSPKCFLPAPEVWSAIISMKKRQEPVVPLGNPVLYRQLVKWAFSYRRKQLSTLLRKPPDFLPCDANACHTALKTLAINPCARPGDLSVAEWGKLANALTT